MIERTLEKKSQACFAVAFQWFNDQPAKRHLIALRAQVLGLTDDLTCNKIFMQIKINGWT